MRATTTRTLSITSASAPEVSVTERAAPDWGAWDSDALAAGAVEKERLSEWFAAGSVLSEHAATPASAMADMARILDCMLYRLLRWLYPAE
jgi:hypothetical protein